jgi:DNA-directed RNA polymerase subunit RPC12/RpoP
MVLYNQLVLGNMWSKEIVNTLERIQKDPLHHSYTCGTEGCGIWVESDCGVEIFSGTELVATTEGFRCPTCGYKQLWY